MTSSYELVLPVKIFVCNFLLEGSGKASVCIQIHYRLLFPCLPLVVSSFFSLTVLLHSIRSFLINSRPFGAHPGPTTKVKTRLNYIISSTVDHFNCPCFNLLLIFWPNFPTIIGLYSSLAYMFKHITCSEKIVLTIIVNQHFWCLLLPFAKYNLSKKPQLISYRLKYDPAIA